MGEIHYLYLDASYEKVRDVAVLVATGITPEGECQVLGVTISLSEHEIHWKAFLKALKDRSLNGVQLVVSDDHEGLRAARRAVLGKCSLAKMPVPPAAKRRSLCATSVHSDGNGRRSLNQWVQGPHGGMLFEPLVGHKRAYQKKALFLRVQSTLPTPFYRPLSHSPPDSVPGQLGTVQGPALLCAELPVGRPMGRPVDRSSKRRTTSSPESWEEVV